MIGTETKSDAICGALFPLNKCYMEVERIMDFEAIKKAAQDYRPAMVKFLRDMIAIPSESCEEEGVARRIAQELESLGYDKVEFDKLGNVIG